MCSRTLIMIPVFNGEKFIQRTIDSCVNQTLKTEVWVVDNCSTDRTREIVEKYVEKGLARLIVNEQNYGRFGGWNRCLDLFAQSAYEYIKFVFCGDEIFPRCIEECEKILISDRSIGALAFPYEFVDLSGNLTISRMEKYANTLFDEKTITRINLAEGMLLGAIICNVYSKSAIRDIRFDTSVSFSKASFDIRVLEHSKAYYLDLVLARLNLDSRNTFNDADSSFGYMEFSYIEAREHHRISKTEKFSAEENKYIQQKIIINCLKHQLRFMTANTKFVLLYVLLFDVVKAILRPFKRVCKKVLHG